MTQTTQAAEKEPGKKGQRPAKVAVEAERAGQQSPVSQLLDGPVRALGAGSGQEQAARLGDIRLQNAQRRALARQIGRIQGNVHLQGLLGSLDAKEAGSGRVPLGQRRRVQSGAASPAVQREGVVQRVLLDIAALGLAAFSEGRTLATSGALSHSANTPSYMHASTPTSERWQNRSFELHIAAHHPRYGYGDQHFYFLVQYECNGYDIRNATVNILRDKSSRMIMSDFVIRWGGQAHSQPTDPVAKIIFNISGHWDPTGLGIASFWGRLVISASHSAGNYEQFTIDSERGTYGPRVWAVT